MLDPELISIGLAVQGRKDVFYRELSDFNRAGCTDFVSAYVLPLLQGGEYLKTSGMVAAQLHEWLSGLGDDVLLATDAPEFDLAFMRELLRDFWPANVRTRPFKFHEWSCGGDLTSLLAETRVGFLTAPGRSAHHALCDAQALREMFRVAVGQGWDPGANHGR